MHLYHSLMGTTLLATAIAHFTFEDVFGYHKRDMVDHLINFSNFSEVPASHELLWFSCFDDYNPYLSCANLLVPLDYDDITTPYIHTAWIKYAPFNDSAEDILFNPGGPGVSGVDLVKEAGDVLALMLGSKYNIVGFDPRGVGFSGPELSCNSTMPRFMPLTLPLPELYQLAYAYGQYCTRANAKTDAEYAGTMATAKDIMHFVSLHHSQKNGHQAESRSERTPIVGETKKETRLKGEAKLWYYGVSYGTVLGQTLAALYPNQIGRMILDGNTDGVQYYTGVTPSDVDAADAAFHDFFATCYEAGPKMCPYYGNATSVDDIENRYLVLLQNLREMPAPDVSGPRVRTDIDVVYVMFDAMYRPLTEWWYLAESLARLEFGYHDVAYGRRPTNPPGRYSQRSESADDAPTFITCLDADKNFAIESFDNYLEAIEVYKKESYYAGYFLSLLNLRMCIGMDLAPPPSQQFPGFNMSGTRTSFPILFVNPLRDPITPISSAYKMSSLFPGSSVLALNASGHSTLSAPSACIHQALWSYLQKGTLPPSGTVCQPNRRPFGLY
ncbi:alpha/beta-hydrolase [Lentithecium fluviatile CBS 122367]|uniref:Alpha/beta-hydrolase n=1 Tax=Lentithecium fluviatile CBS 122367 TaxID=1168545 RepID=A0A6G1J4C5_9PLEO|nr:alpha/beta-hydrolase [Lentithecium fluviatile CBS 122367]